MKSFSIQGKKKRLRPHVLLQVLFQNYTMLIQILPCFLCTMFFICIRMCAVAVTKAKVKLCFRELKPLLDHNTAITIILLKFPRSLCEDLQVKNFKM